MGKKRAKKVASFERKSRTKSRSSRPSLSQPRGVLIAPILEQMNWLLTEFEAEYGRRPEAILLGPEELVQWRALGGSDRFWGIPVLLGEGGVAAETLVA